MKLSFTSALKTRPANLYIPISPFCVSHPRYQPGFGKATTPIIRQVISYGDRPRHEKNHPRHVSFCCYFLVFSAVTSLLSITGSDHGFATLLEFKVPPGKRPALHLFAPRPLAQTSFLYCYFTLLLSSSCVNKL